MDKQLLYNAVEAKASTLTTLSDQIWEYAELSMEEYRSAAAYISLLKEEGFSVKKGEKAILLWAQPVASNQSKEAATEAGKTEEEAKEDYFPVCHVFASCQVQQMKNN